MEDYAKNTYKKWYKKWWGIIIIILGILFFSLIIAFGFLLLNLESLNLNQGGLTENNNINKAENELINGSANNYWLGSANPKITIVEFGDFACSQCQESFPTIREIGEKYKNDVKIIFRDYPVISENSASLALAARCAGEQGLFWPMYDKLFLNQDTSASQINEMAVQVGANLTNFKNCINSQKYMPNIQKDFEDGQELGIAGTPTWFINGIMVEGNIPYNDFVKAIEEILNN